MIFGVVIDSFVNNHFLVRWLGGGGRLTGEPEYTTNGVLKLGAIFLRVTSYGKIYRKAASLEVMPAQSIWAASRYTTKFCKLNIP
jgi:hypothetical protein